MTWTLRLTRPLPLTLQFDVTISGEQMTGKAHAELLLTSSISGKRMS